MKKINKGFTSHAHLQDHIVSVGVVSDVTHIRDIMFVPKSIIPKEALNYLLCNICYFKMFIGRTRYRRLVSVWFETNPN